jgi:hypothetical protein
MSNTTNAPLNHNTIARPASRLWKKSDLNKVVKQCREAGYDVITTDSSITVGLIADDIIVLKALKGHGNWLTRFDQKLFDQKLFDETFEG